ncbi:Uncharacterised protein [Mycobacteroides abscessus subsp. massiliense]|nr:Uncharacterised protein [Mycobacteroides abscessus subsp. massiliense]
MPDGPLAVFHAGVDLNQQIVASVLIDVEQLNGGAAEPALERLRDRLHDLAVTGAHRDGRGGTFRLRRTGLLEAQAELIVGLQHLGVCAGHTG